MPQWDFLDFLARHGAAYPTFRLLMRVEATGLLEEAGRVASTPEGPWRVRAGLVVAADGRGSAMRARAGLSGEAFGAPMDVLWFRLSRALGDPPAVMGRFDAGRIFISLNRGEHWQCGFVIAKGSLDELRARGLDEIRSWDDVKLLTVQIDRLRRWYRPGLLCIGDAAHAMSPVGGVGINLAIQDAVATANRLAGPLAAGRVTLEHLRAVQRRRGWPTRLTQRLQLAVQRRVIATVLATRGPLRPPLFFRLLARVPVLRRLPARLVGLGVRPEHVQAPAQTAARTIAST